jgi:hypothetical protein
MMKRFLCLALGLLALGNCDENGTELCEEFPTGYYVGVAVGAVNNPWKDNASPVGGPSTVLSGPDWTNGNWALTAGGFFGYQINTTLSFEMGGFWFDSVQIKEKISNITTAAVTQIDLKINELYALFAAAGVQAPVGPLYLNVKVGAGYQHVGVENAPTASTFFHSFHNAATFGPMFGAAILYPFSSNVVGVRYDRFAGKFNHHKGKYVLNTNVITATYAFYF